MTDGSRLEHHDFRAAYSLLEAGTSRQSLGEGRPAVG